MSQPECAKIADSSGCKDKLGSISKQGDRCCAAFSQRARLPCIRYAKIYGTQYRPWLTVLLARRPTKVAAIALANKTRADDVVGYDEPDKSYKEPVALAARTRPRRPSGVM